MMFLEYASVLHIAAPLKISEHYFLHTNELV